MRQADNSHNFTNLNTAIRNEPFAVCLKSYCHTVKELLKIIMLAYSETLSKRKTEKSIEFTNLIIYQTSMSILIIHDNFTSYLGKYL